GHAERIDLGIAWRERKRVVRALVPDDEGVPDGDLLRTRDEEQRSFFGEPREIGRPARPPRLVVGDEREFDDRAMMTMKREKEGAQIIDGLAAGPRHGDLLEHARTLPAPGRRSWSTATRDA